ncbi:hypothetical protein GCM10027191_15910 [Novilysobacter erysipheiresistens]
MAGFTHNATRSTDTYRRIWFPSTPPTQWAAVDAAMQTIEDNLLALAALSATEIGRLDGR